MASSRIDGDLLVSGRVQADSGFFPALARSGLAQDNFAVYGIDFAALRVWDAFSTLIATAASDDLGISTGGTWGTHAPYITAGDVKTLGATTRRARFLFTLPAEYVSAESVRISAWAGMTTTVADVSCTLDFEAYKLDLDGTVGGSDLVTTSATTINSLTFGEKTFDLTSSGLVAGDVLDIRVSIASNDAASGTAVIPSIAHLRLLLDIKG